MGPVSCTPYLWKDLELERFDFVLLKIVFIRGSSTIARLGVRYELRTSVVRKLRSCPGHSGLRPGWAAHAKHQVHAFITKNKSNRVFFLFSFGLVGSNCVGLEKKTIMAR